MIPVREFGEGRSVEGACHPGALLGAALAMFHGVLSTLLGAGAAGFDTIQVFFVGHYRTSLVMGRYCSMSPSSIPADSVGPPRRSAAATALERPGTPHSCLQAVVARPRFPPGKRPATQ